MHPKRHNGFFHLSFCITDLCKPQRDRNRGRGNKGEKKEVHAETVGGNTAVLVCVHLCLSVCACGNSIRAPLASCELHFQQRSASVLGPSPGRQTHIHTNTNTYAHTQWAEEAGNSDLWWFAIPPTHKTHYVETNMHTTVPSNTVMRIRFVYPYPISAHLQQTGEVRTFRFFQ